MLESQKRMSSIRNDYTMGNAAMPQSIAFNAMHGTSFNPAQRGSSPMQLQRNQSTEVFTTDPDAPPLPTAPASRSTTPKPATMPRSTTPKPPMPRNTVGHFQQSRSFAPSLDNENASPGSSKLEVAARDRGMVNPHHSADSGYGSTAPSTATHSRAPSITNVTQDSEKPSMPQNSSFLPELSLSEELAQDPAFSEHSFSDDVTPAEPPARREQDRVVRQDFSAPSTSNADARPSNLKSSPRSPKKETRFAEPLEPVPTLPEAFQKRQERQEEAQAQTQGNERAKPKQQPESHPVTPSRFSMPAPAAPSESLQSTALSRDLSSVSQAYQQYEPPSVLSPGLERIMNLPSPSNQVQQQPPRVTSPEPQVEPQAHQQPQQQYPQPLRFSSPEPPQDRQVYQQPQHQDFQPPRFALPAPYQEPQYQFAQHQRSSSPALGEPQPHFASPPRSSSPAMHLPQLERVTSPYQRAVLPPLSVLEGFKVNKRGKVLDEEGDPIGELFEGDIIDCVRQRANAFGEVLDEYGSIVGRVRTIARGAESPMLGPFSTGTNQPGWFHAYPTPTTTPPAARRASTVSQSDQYHYFSQHTEHMAHPQPRFPMPFVQPQQPAVAPLDHGSEGFRVELDASEQSESLPVFDHSDIFLPPFIPCRSPKRPESPTLPEGRQSPPKLPTPPRSTRNSREYNRAEAAAMLRPKSTPPQSLQQPQRSADSEAPQKPASILKSQQQPSNATVAPGILRPKSTPPQMLSRVVNEGSNGRPPMTPVPEAPQEEGPALFSYRGEIPAQDGPVSNAGVAPNRVKSPPLPSFPRQAFTGGLPGGSPFVPMNVGEIKLSSSGMPMPSRRVTTGGTQVRPGLKARLSTNTPLIRSPLSSHGKAFPI